MITEIAEARNLSRQLVEKIVTMLSSAGLVEGKPGPSGGYQLARPASKIALLDVVKVFEDPQWNVMCPFGPNSCMEGSLYKIDQFCILDPPAFLP